LYERFIFAEKNPWVLMGQISLVEAQMFVPSVALGMVALINKRRCTLPDAF
jgi:hypothetical protein